MSSTSLDLRRAETRDIDYVERARRLAPMLIEAADEIEERRQLPERVVEALIEGGFFRLLLPRSLGGAELHPLTYVQVLEEIAKAEPIDRLVARAEFRLLDVGALSRPGGGARDLRAAARHPRLGAGAAGRRARRRRRGRHPGHRALGVCDRQPARHLARRACPDLRAGRHAAHEPERPAVCPHRAVPEVERRDHRQLAGHRACAAPAATATGSRISSSRRNTPLSRDNPAERREPGLLYRFTSGMIYAMGFSNVSLGIARGALDAFIELARDKIPRGARKTLRENNVIQSEVAQCEAKLRSSRAFIHATLEEMWEEAERNGDFAPEQHAQLRLAATWAIHQARDVVARGLQRRRLDRGLQREPVRAPPARHPRRDPARPRPPGPFRDRRPDPVGPAARGTHVPVAGGPASMLRTPLARISRKPATPALRGCRRGPCRL